MSPGAEAFWQSGFWHRRSRVVNLESRLEGVVFCCSCCGHVGNALRVVQVQRHVHSATGSGLPAGFAGSPQALAVEVDPVGVMDQAIENGVGVGGVAD